MWSELFKFELLYRLKRPGTYLYFFVLFSCGLGAIDFIYHGMLGAVKENAPYVIAHSMAVSSAMLILVASMIMGVSILRDFQYRMESFMFVTPIRKTDYLLGRFLGSFVILVFIFSGLLFGMMMSPYLPWRDPGNQLEQGFWTYLYPFLVLVIPNLFFAGALFFVSGALGRKLVIVYTQGILLLVIYTGCMILFNRGGHRSLFALLDPFALNTIDYIIEKWAVAQRNTAMIPLDGLLLYNRLTWIGMGGVAFAVGYFGFSFNVIRHGLNKKKDIPGTYDASRVRMEIPAVNITLTGFSLVRQFWYHTFFYTRSIITGIPFWAITISGVAIILLNGIQLGTTFGVPSLPKSYLVVEELTEMSLYFFLLLLVIYPGELVWQERDVRMNLVYDATPMGDAMNLVAKYLGLLFIYVILLLTMMLAGMLAQGLNGYHQYDIATYFYGFFVDLFPFLAIYTLAAFFLQVMANHKFIGHLLVILFLIATTAMEVFGLDHDLIRFGGDTLGRFSEMNGYGAGLASYLWVKTYWMAFGLILLALAIPFTVRGVETRKLKRIQLAKERVNTSFIAFLGVIMILFGGTGCWIYYNTNVLNAYVSPFAQKRIRADYEKTLKQWEYVPQPKIVEVKLNFDLYPGSRDYYLQGTYLLVNKGDTPIPSIHVQALPMGPIDLAEVNFSRASTKVESYDSFNYTVYDLVDPLLPQDSIEMYFTQSFITEGFVEGKPNRDVVENGTFITNDHLPSSGYNRQVELRDPSDREDMGLPERVDRAKIDDPIEIRQARTGDDGYKINFEAIIGTHREQVAIAPGNLVRQWQEKGRNYFHYKMEAPMVNFYSLVSGKYQVRKDVWKRHDSPRPVALEIYYHQGHELNLDRMIHGMKASLHYFSDAFGPYPYDHLRIMEFPRYKRYAQSFPATIPYSEDLGFILDINDEEDIDMVFYVTAHEVAHQWWGLQLVAANVEGRHMLLESLAQYSALMLLKRHYTEEKVQKFLKSELDQYFQGRAAERKGEKPLALTTGQQYIHYRKGAFNLYTLQDYVSEDSVNMALNRFVKDWNCFDGPRQQDRYATSRDLLDYFREVTPGSLQYVIEDLFESITLYDLAVENASYDQLDHDQYDVFLEVNAKKFKADRWGNESAVKVNDWVDVGVYTENGEGKKELIYLKKHHLKDSLQTIKVYVESRPIHAGIDPKSRLVERNFEDNVVTLDEYP